MVHYLRQVDWEEILKGWASVLRTNSESDRAESLLKSSHKYLRVSEIQKDSMESVWTAGKSSTFCMQIPVRLLPVMIAQAKQIPNCDLESENQMTKELETYER